MAGREQSRGHAGAHPARTDKRNLSAWSMKNTPAPAASARPECSRRARRTGHQVRSAAASVVPSTADLEMSIGALDCSRIWSTNPVHCASVYCTGAAGIRFGVDGQTDSPHEHVVQLHRMQVSFRGVLAHGIDERFHLLRTPPGRIAARTSPPAPGTCRPHRTANRFSPPYQAPLPSRSETPGISERHPTRRTQTR